MNEQELDQALRAIGTRHVRPIAPPALRELAMAIPSATPERRRRWLFPTWRFQTVFNATKFALAGVIVALVGGYLLTGVLPTRVDGPSDPAAVTTAAATPEASVSPDPVTEPTTSPDAVIRTDLLPGVSLTVEEVGPGMLRVLDDGAGHDLEASLAGVHAVSGTGDVWVETGGSSAITFRLGGQESYLTRDGMQVAPDGSFWWMSVPIRGTPVLHHLVGDDVVEQPLPDVDVPDDDSGRDNYSTFDITPDRRVWIAIDRGRQEPLVAVLEEGEWTVLPPLGSAWTRGRNAKELLGEHDFSGMAVTPNGAVWLVDAGPHLMRYSNGEWRTIEPKRFGGWASDLAAGPDGTLWVKGGRSLARHDARGWKVWDDAMAWDCAAAYCEEQTVGNDGTLWLRFDGHIGGATKQLVERGIIRRPKPGPDTPACDGEPGDSPGVLSFDGKRWRQYLAGHCVSDIAVARNGSVWATDAGGELDAAGAGLYVITPEAMSAAG